MGFPAAQPSAQGNDIPGPRRHAQLSAQREGVLNGVKENGSCGCGHRNRNFPSRLRVLSPLRNSGPPTGHGSPWAARHLRFSWPASAERWRMTDPPPGPKALKRSLRTALRNALQEMPPARRAAESAQLCAAVRQLPEYQKARTVTLFCPMPFEADLLELLNDVRTPPGELGATGPRNGGGRRFLFPLTHDDRSLTWHETRSVDELSPGRLGIPEPDPIASPAVDPEEIDLVIVPGLGFTLQGGRLGFGGGYYDRFLAKTGPAVATVGVCLSCQVVPPETIPMEPHDISLLRVVAPGC
ncbi:MAG: 5-formyltetrahydrofolate cyclo-ligase [Verrucomicrobiaceae bacterium]|nr:MAG: 5-formyltetrahydrofolate cyclo-ligase [Verrucomicrobiaceae bacterium]